MSPAAPSAGIRKKTSPAPLGRDPHAPVRPASPATTARRGLPTVAILSAALAASAFVTVGCQGNEADDDVVAERHVRKPARPVDRDPGAPPTGSVVTIASTAPTPVPTPVPIALGGAAVPVMPTPPPVPTTKATTTKPLPKPVSSALVPTPLAMPGGMRAVEPST